MSTKKYQQVTKDGPDQDTEYDNEHTLPKTEEMGVPKNRKADNSADLTKEIDRESDDGSSSESLLPNYHEKMVIKSTAYAVYSIRFWQFFTMMIFANFFGCFFAYSFKTFGESSSEGHEQISD